MVILEVTASSSGIENHGTEGLFGADDEDSPGGQGEAVFSDLQGVQHLQLLG